MSSMAASGLAAAPDAPDPASSETKQQQQQQQLRLVSWNIAAINNNPFEYWISYDNVAYNELMADVQSFIQTPGDNDVLVEEVFSEAMFQELKAEMGGLGWSGLEETEAQWRDNFRGRRIMSGFIKDAELGSKRLASMPDRLTNTVNLADGSKAFRPTPINCYEGHFASFEDWWAQWKSFMFKDLITVSSKGKEKSVVAAQLLVPIKKAKYPAITEAEEAISVPLQTLCAALFDAILVHLLNQVSPDTASWQALRKELSTNLNLQKNQRTLEILEQAYSDADVIFLQEVANSFVAKIKDNAKLEATFEVVVPETDGKRDQNSIMLLKKSAFQLDSLRDVTSLVYEKFEGKTVPVAQGDLVAAVVNVNVNVKPGAHTAADAAHAPLLLASFHGDTNGLATVPVLDAVHATAQTDLAQESPRLVFGMDANTYGSAKPGKSLGVHEFSDFFRSLHMNSCWGLHPDPAEYTTHNARTFLQPQLNKAASKEEIMSKGDVNAKDYILFYQAHFEPVGKTLKDNTGTKGVYTPDMVFPTLTFPSDHAVIHATIAALPAAAAASHSEL